MSKASDYKKHSDSVVFDSDPSREPVINARVLQDGTLHLNFPRNDWMNSGIKPATALALGKWIVEHFEERPTAQQVSEFLVSQKGDQLRGGVGTDPHKS